MHVARHVELGDDFDVSFVRVAQNLLVVAHRVETGTGSERRWTGTELRQDAGALAQIVAALRSNL